MNRCIKIRTHTKFQIKITPGTSWDVVFLRLSLLGFVLPYIFLLYLIWYVDILFCIMFGLFLRTRVTKNTINYNYRYYYHLQKKPNCPGNRRATSDSSIPSLSSFYLLRFYLPSIQYLHQSNYLMQQVQSPTNE